ncbi:unannotated protein [freshwater metagenome]|uniref:Unannotated protein n=1 Tax=freshwater metagenome TaxID=449393 RepID=A0A6J7H9P1_9ZZZZ
MSGLVKIQRALVLAHCRISIGVSPSYELGNTSARSSDSERNSSVIEMVVRS